MAGAAPWVEKQGRSGSGDRSELVEIKKGDKIVYRIGAKQALVAEAVIAGSEAVIVGRIIWVVRPYVGGSDRINGTVKCRRRHAIGPKSHARDAPTPGGGDAVALAPLAADAAPANGAWQTVTVKSRPKAANNQIPGARGHRICPLFFALVSR